MMNPKTARGILLLVCCVYDIRTALCADFDSFSEMKATPREYSSGPENPSGYNYPYPSYGGSEPAGASDSFTPSSGSGGSYYGSTYYDSAKKKKPVSYYTPPYYAAHSEPGIVMECQEQMTNGIMGDILQVGGVAKFGLLKSIIAVIVATILAKIPLILAVKALIVKIILVPIGLLVITLPIILPFMLLFAPLWSKIKESFFGGSHSTTPAPQMVFTMPQSGNATANQAPQNQNQRLAREMAGPEMLFDLIESEKCFEKLACQLGYRDLNATYAKPISWMLKFMQLFRQVQSSDEIQLKLKAYRDAYSHGIRSRINGTTAYKYLKEKHEEYFCSEQLYPCNVLSVAPPTATTKTSPHDKY